METYASIPFEVQVSKKAKPLVSCKAPVFQFRNDRLRSIFLYQQQQQPQPNSQNSSGIQTYQQVPILHSSKPQKQGIQLSSTKASHNQNVQREKHHRRIKSNLVVPHTKNLEFTRTETKQHYQAALSSLNSTQLYLSKNPFHSSNNNYLYQQHQQQSSTSSTLFHSNNHNISKHNFGSNYRPRTSNSSQKAFGNSSPPGMATLNINRKKLSTEDVDSILKRNRQIMRALNFESVQNYNSNSNSANEDYQDTKQGQAIVRERIGGENKLQRKKRNYIIHRQVNTGRTSISSSGGGDPQYTIKAKDSQFKPQFKVVFVEEDES